MHKNAITVGVLGGGFLWVLIIWALFGFVQDEPAPALTQDEFNEILHEDMQLLCSADGRVVAKSMGLTFDEAALDVWCGTPTPPTILL